MGKEIFFRECSNLLEIYSSHLCLLMETILSLADEVTEVLSSATL